MGAITTPKPSDALRQALLYEILKEIDVHLGVEVIPLELVDAIANRLATYDNCRDSILDHYYKLVVDNRKVGMSLESKQTH